MPVADRVGKDVPERFALPEPLHGVHGVVERIGIGAVRPQGQASVQPGFRRFGHEHGHVMGVGIRGRGQGAVEHAQRVFRHESERRADRGGIVGTVDGQGQGVGRRAAVPVADGVGKGVGEGFAHAECLHGGQGVVEGVGVRAVGIERQASVQPGLRRFGYEHGRVMGVRIRGRGQGAGGGQPGIFGDGSGCGGDGRRVVGAVDGYGQGA